MFKSYFLSLIYLVFLTVSCQTIRQSSDGVVDRSALEIAIKSVKAHGGTGFLEEKQFKFKKFFELYDEDGTVALSRNEQHMYDFGARNFSIRWTDDGVAQEYLQDQSNYAKYVANNPDDAMASNRVAYAMEAGKYAFALPFRLLDDDIVLIYEGLTTFEGRSVHSLRAQYPNEVDIWWHYIDTNSFQHLGYKVAHKDHISLVVNQSFFELGDYILAKNRESWRVDKAGNKLWKRAIYHYSE